MTVYYFTGDKATLLPDISVKNATLRLPAPGQTKGAAFFDIVNNGGADRAFIRQQPH